MMRLFILQLDTKPFGDYNKGWPTGHHTRDYSNERRFAAPLDTE